ncbi:MAG: thiamine kinase [Oceanicoccus sp.]
MPALDNPLSNNALFNSPQLDAALAEWPLWSECEPTTVKPLGNGLTNQSYCVQSPHSQWVLRINANHSHSLDINRQSELQAMSLAADEGITPHCHYSDPHQRYLLTEYIDGEHWSLEKSQSVAGGQQLAQLLQKIHQLPAITAMLDVREKIEKYWQGIDMHSDMAMQLHALTDQLEHHIVASQRLFSTQDNARLCLCHNDLLTENLIIKNESLYAIDWEYAAMGDPFFDLAVICEGQQLDDSTAKQLLVAYLGRSFNKQDLQRLAHQRVIYSYLALLWYALQLTQLSATVNKDDTLAAVMASCSPTKLLQLKGLLSSFTV